MHLSSNSYRKVENTVIGLFRDWFSPPLRFFIPYFSFICSLLFRLRFTCNSLTGLFGSFHLPAFAYSQLNPIFFFTITAWNGSFLTMFTVYSQYSLYFTQKIEDIVVNKFLIGSDEMLLMPNTDKMHSLFLSGNNLFCFLKELI